MNKKALSVLALLLVVLATACSKDEEDYCINGDGIFVQKNELFDEEYFGLRTHVGMVIQPNYSDSVSINGEQNVLNRISYLVKNQSLLFDFSKCIRKYQDLEIALDISQLDSLVLNNHATLISKEPYQFNQLQLKAIDSFTADFNSISKQFNCMLNGKGTAKFKGSTNLIKLDIQGENQLVADSFIAKRAIIDHYGDADITIAVSDTLNCSIYGSGNVYYKGDPYVIKNILGTGSLIKM